MIHSRSAKLLAIVVAFGQAVLAESGDPLVGTFEMRYQELETAVASRESAAISALLAEGFTAEDCDGSVTEASRWIEEMTAQEVDLNRVSSATVLSVALGDGEAVVQQRYEMQTQRENPTSHAREQVQLVAVTTDSWVLVSETWLLKKSVAQTVDAWVDGQLQFHQEHR